MAEVVLGSVDEIKIPEIKVSYDTSLVKKFSGKISKSNEVASLIRDVFNTGEIELQEQFIVLYLDQAYQIIGYYKHSKGLINATVADIRIILGAALKCACVAMIVAHNHPSGNVTASEADKQLTQKLKESAELMSIKLLDHIIVTKDSFYSFADNALCGLVRQVPHEQFIEQVEGELQRKASHNKTSLEKLAASYCITDKTEVKELTELAIVKQARKIAKGDQPLRERYERIVELYHSQVNLSHRTSHSILLQQYSTPAPIGFIAGIFCRLDKLHTKGGYGFEPSAGNGLLTVAGKPERIYVNEIDRLRNSNLKTQGFANVWQRDASMPFFDVQRNFVAVISNPPFGRLDKPVLFDTYRIDTLDHLMALRALETMTNDGRAAIIIGGHTRYDDKGRIERGRNRIFFNYLYSRYHVADVLQIDGHKLYSRQGTAFDTRLILINGRKEKPEGAAPVHDPQRDEVIKTFDELYNRVTGAMDIPIVKDMNRLKQLEQEALALQDMFGFGTLGAPYMPASDSCVVLNTQVPDSMAFETQSAVARIKEEVGGNIDNFVRHRLQFPSHASLCKALSAEQIDAVAMAIYNIEARGQGMIIGDQTGIGKGRIAASMIRYAVCQGLKPVFLTEKANLFSDIYRDLSAIGSGKLKPFIVNGREPKTDIKDEDGNVIYTAPAVTEQQSIFKSRKVPEKYDFVVATYSQFNSPEKKPEKPLFLQAIAEGNIFIMDEAHNSSGSSNTGEFLQGVVRNTKGVVFLSATFAKRPDNMPIYGMKTAIADCNMSKDELVEAITKGGVALQEVLSSQLVAEGQMLRRERSFEGVEVNYISLDEKTEEHRAIADNITEVLRDIIDFQGRFINEAVDELDKVAVAEGKEVELREGTSQAGVDNQPYFSKVFQVINQMLFSLKAEAVAERAIMRLQEGKKPVIAFASTMGSFIETLENEQGLPVSDGDVINADFSEVMKRGLDGILRYTEKDVDGNSVYKKFELSELPPEAQVEYLRIAERIKSVATGITISPIDVIVKRLKEAGYSVAEVTGRKYELQFNGKGSKALITSRKKLNTNDAFRQFNNNEVDVLMINQSGSTGASAHAIPTAKVPATEVRQRVMIVLQAELDINTEVQKRGRINRTGQILKPIYDYVTSAIPAEKRLMMMLQKKLKSLDANTTSNQKQSTKILDVPDFLNKYGDKIVKEYLLEYPDINRLLDDPLKLEDSKADSDSNTTTIEDAAHKVSGRVAVLSTKMQQDFYNEVAERYNDYEAYLRQVGEYDLEVEAMNLDAETINSRIVKMGKGSDSAFGEDSILETIRANVLKKPFTRAELSNLLNESLKDKDAITQQRELIDEYQNESRRKLFEEEQDVVTKYEELIKNVPNEKKVRKIAGEQEREKAIRERENELATAREGQLKIIRTKAHNRSHSLEKIFRFFYVGRNLRYPIETFSSGNELVPAVFIGYGIDRKKKNPFAPSQIKLRFAIANSSKYLSIPASYSQDIMAIIGASSDVSQPDKEGLLTLWEDYTRQNHVDRKIRHTITGNLLQAFSDFKGKLVSYTTIDGRTVKGILMPENWNPGDEVQDKVVVPIIKALPLIKSLVNGGHIVTSNGISFFRQGGYFKVIVAASRAKGGDIYLDKEILEVVENNNFEKTSDKMYAIVADSNIGRLVEILQANHSCAVTVNSAQFRLIGSENQRYSSRRKIDIPEAMPDLPATDQSNIISLLELEAEALALELELLAA